MTVTAPPRRPDLTDPHDAEPLDALIEEARRRARRRRQRYGTCALLLTVAAGAVAFYGFGGRDGDDGGTQTPPAPPAAAGGTPPIRVPVAASNGPVTILDGEGISTVSAPGVLRTLVRCGKAEPTCPAYPFSVDWAPDGRHLAYSVAVGPAAAAERWKVVGLHILNTVTGRHRSVRTDCFATGIDWSPDGSRLAYACDGRIFLVRFDLSEPTLLRTGTPGADTSPSWSPDGARIAFESRLNGRSAIYVTRVHSLTRGSMRLVGGARAPSWSPDGTTIAYWAGCGGVKLVTPEGVDVTPPVRRTSSCAIGIRGAPAWSPDGRQIAMGTAHWPGGCGDARDAPVRLSGVCVLPGTYVMNADGGKLRVIVRLHGGSNFAGGGRPTWQPLPRR